MRVLVIQASNAFGDRVLRRNEQAQIFTFKPPQHSVREGHFPIVTHPGRTGCWAGFLKRQYLRSPRSVITLCEMAAGVQNDANLMAFAINKLHPVSQVFGDPAKP